MCVGRIEGFSAGAARQNEAGTKKGKEYMGRSVRDAGFVGIDVGSSFVHCAVVSEQMEVIYSPKPLMHFANPIGAVREAWLDIRRRVGAERIVSTAFTGSGAEAFPKVMRGVAYLYDSVAIPKGAQLVGPAARYIFTSGPRTRTSSRLGG
jgi:activator of 2-hydroxyglutaryl-CoA dehydratase